MKCNLRMTSLFFFKEESAKKIKLPVDFMLSKRALNYVKIVAPVALKDYVWP